MEKKIWMRVRAPLLKERPEVGLRARKLLRGRRQDLEERRRRARAHLRRVQRGLRGRVVEGIHEARDAAGLGRAVGVERGDLDVDVADGLDGPLGEVVAAAAAAALLVVGEQRKPARLPFGESPLGLPDDGHAGGAAGEQDGDEQAEEPEAVLLAAQHAEEAAAAQQRHHQPEREAAVRHADRTLAAQQIGQPFGGRREGGDAAEDAEDEADGDDDERRRERQRSAHVLP